MQIDYIPRREMTLADTMNHLSSNENTDAIDIDVQVDLRFSSECLNEIRLEMK